MTQIWGAIRWDWNYRGLGNDAAATTQELQTLESAYARSRAPLHFQSTGPNTGIMADTQATFDAEITAAVSAGLKYWAFLRYSVGAIIANVHGTYGLQYYQASSHNNLINWCSMISPQLFGSTGSYGAQIATIVSELQQSNYQKVLSNRPLLYIYWNTAEFATYWGSSLSNFAAMVTALRAACISAGMGTPYIVVCNGLDVSVLNAIGADAASNYNPVFTYPLQAPFATYDTAVRAYWAAMAALGKPIIPIASVGWDTRARALRPPTWEPNIYPYFGLNNYVTPPTSAEITTHLAAGVAYINANPSICPAATGLIYAWNECAECGTPLIPTLGDPTGTRCTAAGAALIGA